MNNTKLIIFANVSDIIEEQNEYGIHFKICTNNLRVECYKNFKFDYAFEDKTFDIHYQIDLSSEFDRQMYDFLHSFELDDEVEIVGMPKLIVDGIDTNGLLHTTYELQVQNVINNSFSDFPRMVNYVG